MQRYELTFITRGELSQEQLDEQRNSVINILKTAECSLIDQYDWGLRSLAYPIKRQTRGFYTTILFDGSSGTVHRVESKIRLNENILRFLSVSVPKTQKKIVIKEKNNASSQE